MKRTFRIMSKVALIAGLGFMFSLIVKTDVKATGLRIQTNPTELLAHGFNGVSGNPISGNVGTLTANHTCNSATGVHYVFNGWDISGSYSNVSIETQPDKISFTYGDGDVTVTANFIEVEKESYDVTFKVRNGSWNDGTTADKKVTIWRYVDEDMALVLNTADIPAVGNNPAQGYTRGRR